MHLLTTRQHSRCGSNEIGGHVNEKWIMFVNNARAFSSERRINEWWMLMPIQMGGQISPPPRLGSVLLLLLQNEHQRCRPSNTSHGESERLLMNEWMDGGWIGKTLWNGECEMGEWKYKSLLLPIHISTYHRKSYEYQITAILRRNCNVKGSGGGKGRSDVRWGWPSLIREQGPDSQSIQPSIRSIYSSVHGWRCAMIKKYTCTSLGIETEVEEDTA